ncbi:hypothetical protein [Streptomyces olivochromogenes]|uniref:hypothetical protein n=1 Tax=Streptomyces olivochromogenes TaxID=1963 RepID=UPI0036B220B1
MSDKIEDLLTRIEAATSVAEVRALVTRLRRARRRRDDVSAETSPDPGQGTGPDEVDHDTGAAESGSAGTESVLEQQLRGIWVTQAPPRRRSPYSRVIDGRPVDDPGGYGQRNDARRWSPWR